MRLFISNPNKKDIEKKKKELRIDLGFEREKKK